MNMQCPPVRRLYTMEEFTLELQEQVSLEQIPVMPLVYMI